MRFLVLIAILALKGYSADFTTYIGDANQYQVAAIATDSAGNSYVTGSRTIESAPASSSDDVFVTKLDASGDIVFTSTFGGKGSDVADAIAADSAGNIWVGGNTTSENFPLRDALQTGIGSGGAGFLVKLAPDGTVIYSSYFGGLMGATSVNGLATDPGGNVYLTGGTSSSDFPTTPGLPAGMVHDELGIVSGAFITKLDPTGLKIVYSALIAGTAIDCSGGSTCDFTARTTSGVGIALDEAGDALIAGNTNTTDLPVTPGGVAGYEAFVAKINAAGNKLTYLTYLGPGAGIGYLGQPPQTINATAIAADSAGDAYVTGYTNDSEFPATAGAYQTKLDADASTQTSVPPDAFAIKLNTAGATIWATYLGGPGTDLANSISLDSSGDVWLTGNNAAGFPGTSRWVNGSAGNFLSQFSADGSALLYSEEFPAGAVGQGVSVDSNGVIHVAGETGLISTMTPAQPSAARTLGIVNAASGQLSGRLSQGEVISIFGFGLGPTTPVSAKPGSNGFFPTSLGGIQVLVNGAAVPLLYVSASQINAEIPTPLSVPDAVVQIINNSAMLPDFRVSVDASIFGLFLNPDGSVAAINQDGTVNASTNPAKPGTIVTIWATGFGNLAGPIDGAVATVANNWCGDCQVSLNGESATMEYAGAAPGQIDGIMQINFLVPTQLADNEVFLQFSLGGGGFIWVSQ
ncbi:MAG: SBBP repeat-containing protein [Bryobacteraceae bacterium]|jgi:uncharacterized protein (TIGR03437 family)